MKPKSKKEAVITLLEDQKFDELAELLVRHRSNLRYLRRLLCYPGLLRWRAIEGIGAVADRLADDDPEAVRVILRTLLWTINEESGGIGWGAPESMGEIIHRRPHMFEEFASVVLSNVEEQMLRPGVMWAAVRIAQVRPDLVLWALPEYESYLEDTDPVVRGYALLLCKTLGVVPGASAYDGLLNDHSMVPVYENGELKEVAVSELAGRLANQPAKAPQLSGLAQGE